MWLAIVGHSCLEWRRCYHPCTHPCTGCELLTRLGMGSLVYLISMIVWPEGRQWVGKVVVGNICSCLWRCTEYVRETDPPHREHKINAYNGSWVQGYGRHDVQKHTHMAGVERAPLKSVRYYPIWTREPNHWCSKLLNLLEQAREGMDHLYIRWHAKFGGQMACHFRNGVWQIQFKESLC